MNEEMQVNEEIQKTHNLILDENNRIVAIDCFPSKTQKEVQVNTDDFPMPYEEFCFEFHNYSYIENQFVLTEELYGTNLNILEKNNQQLILIDMLADGELNTYLESIPDAKAAKIPLMYTPWSDFIGKALKKDKRIEYGGVLWKVRQDIVTVLENQPPSVETASLYERIDVEHAGTIDDPIPYANTMTVYNGKYYLEDGIKYKCIRDSGQPLYASCASLVGNYFQVVE